jgi:hypothetical protein
LGIRRDEVKVTMIRHVKQFIFDLSTRQTGTFAGEMTLVEQVVDSEGEEYLFRSKGSFFCFNVHLFIPSI